MWFRVTVPWMFLISKVKEILITVIQICNGVYEPIYTAKNLYINFRLLQDDSDLMTEPDFTLD